jgi:hypothetical protein
MQKGQNAIEFLVTYSFVFLIIALVILMLLLFSSIPKSVLPLNCSFYSGLNCVDALYYNTAINSGSRFVMIATDTQPGIINITNFVVSLDYQQSVSGYCTPSVVSDGQELYCSANITTAGVIGNLYTGTFQITGKYCSNGPGSIFSSNCTNGGQVTFGGAVQTQSSLLSSGFFPNLPYPSDIFCVGSSSGTGKQAYYAQITSSQLSHSTR